MKLSALIDEDDFILLGPGYRESGTEWTLLREVRTVPPGMRVEQAVWLGRYETPGSEPMQLTGASVETVQLEFDVAPHKFEISLDDRDFTSAVEVIREAIAAGDVYQVNLTRQAMLQCNNGALLLSTFCRRQVPRFAAWLKLRGVWEVVTASPELLFELNGRTIRAEPMKGTAAPEARAWLEASVKDQAELAMITDLLRDDLNHVCVERSVEVRNARRFIELPYVIQAVSNVTGVLRAGLTLAGVLAQLHPGGSITGAPREAARAMISKLERGPRDFYCGFLGYQHGDHSRVALLIRTAQRSSGDQWRFGVGSGITWDSDPQLELAELKLKLGALS